MMQICELNANFANREFILSSSKYPQFVGWHKINRLALYMFKRINKEEYGKFLNKVKFKTVFHELEWHGFLEKQFKWIRFEYYKYGDEAILPLARFKIFRKEKLVSLPFCEYGGPLIISPNLPAGRQGFSEGGPDINIEDFEKDAFNEFGENAKGELDSLKIKIHPAMNVGGETSDTSTHWIEGLKNKSEQEIWESFRKTLRHEIKNAQEHNLEIRVSKNPKELKRFYNLYVANLRRKRTIPYPWRVYQFLCQNSSSELLLAIYKDKIIGGSLFLQYGGFVHYFLSASDYKYRNLGANYLILWEKIKSLINQDVVLDLGATQKNSSLYTFKSGWGGTEYPIIVLENKKTENSLRSSKLRNLFALLPNFAVKILSSRLIKYRL
jgi:hypothetical protein